MVQEFQTASTETRLGVPLIYGVDAVHGHNNVMGATIFPHNIGLGAANDPELMQRIGAATAAEVAATGIQWDFAPVLAVVQDIRWGRTYEAYGENTDLVTALGVAYQQGLQGDDLSAPDTILATPKHYIGDGGTLWGSSDTYPMDQGDTVMDEATLRRLFLPPYVAAVEAGARSIMISYSSWNGEKLHGQSYLINDVLKGELGFSGFIVSDWEAIDQIPGDYYSDVVASINAGLDMIMVPYDYKKFISTLTKAVEAGDVPQARIDDAVRRILTVKAELGLFDQVYGSVEQTASVGSSEHRALAQEAVAKSLVLLKNDNQVLPIDPAAPVIFVAGVAADDIGIQSGGWTMDWQGRTGNITPGTTILDGIKATVSPQTQVQFNRFGRFDKITDDAGNLLRADVGIVVVGERPYAEGRGDSNDLSLTDADKQAIQRTAEQADKVVVVILSGRPMIISDVVGEADAWVAAWLPGTEGQGVADGLFGLTPFTGKLSFTWPRNNDQLPFDFTALPAQIEAGGCDAPLFPYAYGLTGAETDPFQALDCGEAAAVVEAAAVAEEARGRTDVVDDFEGGDLPTGQGRFRGRGLRHLERRQSCRHRKCHHSRRGCLGPARPNRRHPRGQAGHHHRQRQLGGFHPRLHERSRGRVGQPGLEQLFGPGSVALWQRHGRHPFCGYSRKPRPGLHRGRRRALEHGHHRRLSRAGNMWNCPSRTSTARRSATARPMTASLWSRFMATPWASTAPRTWARRPTTWTTSPSTARPRSAPWKSASETPRHRAGKAARPRST